MELLTIAYYRPRAPQPHTASIAAFQRTALHAMSNNLYQYEVDHILHGYRRTVFDEESIERDFFTGDIEQFKIIKDSAYYKALERTRTAFEPPSPYRPVHLLDIEHHYPLKHNTNAERPFSTDRFFLEMLNSEKYRTINHLPLNPKPSTGNMKNIIFDYVRHWLHEIKEGDVNFDAHLYSMLLHSKSALVSPEDPNKIRTIFGTPKPFVLAEIMFYWPLVAYYKRTPEHSPLLWSYETFTGGWMRLNAQLFNSYSRASILMIDYGRFDKYAYFEMFDDLDAMTESFIDFDHGYMPTKGYPETDITWNRHKANRLRRLFRWTLYAFRNTPIVLPDGRLFRRRFAGIPSGLYTTQYRDSVYNYQMIATLLIHFSLEYNLLRVQGDDSITQLVTVVPPNLHSPLLQAMSLEAKRRFNSIINIAKSKMKNGPQRAEVLGYENNHGIAERNPNQVLAQWYHTKQSDPSQDRAMAACIGYAFALANTSRRHYNVLKDAFNYYASLGYSPAFEHISDVMPEEVFGFIPFTGRFPTWNEISDCLTDYNHDFSKTNRKFWDSDWFLDQF